MPRGFDMAPLSSQERGKLISQVERDVIENHLSAFKDVAEMEKYLGAMYRTAGNDIVWAVQQMQKKIPNWTMVEMQKFGRMKTLLDQINTQVRKLGQAEVNFMDKNLQNMYVDQYLRNIYQLGQKMNVNMRWDSIDPRKVKEAVSYPWSGEMFSDRIWRNKEFLVDNIREGVTQSLILGEGIMQLTKRINAGIDNSYLNAQRVARTEVMRVCYVAERKAFEDNKIKQVKYWATVPSERTCDICGKTHNHDFELGKEPQLPRHPHCRCTYIAILPPQEKDEVLNDLTKETRDAKGFTEFKAKKTRKKKADAALTIEEPTAKYNGEVGRKIAKEMNESQVSAILTPNNQRAYDMFRNRIELQEQDYGKLTATGEKIKENFKKLELVKQGKITKPYALVQQTSKLEYPGTGRKVDVSWVEVVEFEERDGGRFFVNYGSKVAEVEKAEIENKIRAYLKKNPRALGVKVNVDNAAVQGFGKTTGGFYSPTCDTVNLRSITNFRDNWKNKYHDAKYWNWDNVLEHEMGHRFHNLSAKALTEMTLTQQEFTEWKAGIEDYYTMYRKNKLVNFRQEWSRYSYPVNAEDFYKGRLSGKKERFYTEMFAESSAIVTGGDPDELAKMEKFFPKIKDFLSKWYGLK